MPAPQKQYRVCAPYVLLKTATQDGPRFVGFTDGNLVPADVEPEQIEHHLRTKQIIEVGKEAERLAAQSVESEWQQATGRLNGARAALAEAQEELDRATTAKEVADRDKAAQERIAGEAASPATEAPAAGNKPVVRPGAAGRTSKTG